MDSYPTSPRHTTDFSHHPPTTCKKEGTAVSLNHATLHRFASWRCAQDPTGGGVDTIKGVKEQKKRGKRKCARRPQPMDSLTLPVRLSTIKEKTKRVTVCCLRTTNKRPGGSMSFVQTLLYPSYQVFTSWCDP